MSQTRNFQHASADRLRCGAKRSLCIAFALACGVVVAQPAERELASIFNWECAPIFAAKSNTLRVYRNPDLRSESVEWPYRKGWRIPAPLDRGLTRILKVGVLRTLRVDESLHCAVLPTEGPRAPVPGELVTYVHKHVEGRGAVEFRGGECVARTDVSFGVFELVVEPETQEWLRMYLADGTSPGWILNDFSQAALWACGG